MSEENVEIVRRSFDLWSEGSLDEWAQAFDPEVVVQPPDGWPEGEVRGLDAWLRQAERLRDTWEQAHTELDEIRAVGADRVVVRLRYVTLGERGMSFDTPMAAMFVLRNGKITHGDYFWDFAEALEAAGLSE